MGFLENISERKVTTPIQKHLRATQIFVSETKIRVQAHKTTPF